MKFYDLGNSQKIEDTAEEVFYPKQSFDEDILPGLSGREVGEELVLTIKARVSSVGVSGQGKGVEKTYTLEFLGANLEEKETDRRRDFIKELEGEGERKKKEDFGEDITRVPGQNSV